MVIPRIYLIAGGLVACAALYVAIRGVRGAAEGVGGAIVETAGGVGRGVVVTLGDVLNVPRTNETACQKAKREGRTLDASFACPAGEWLQYVFS